MNDEDGRRRKSNYFGRQQSFANMDFESPQGSQLSEVGWDGIGRAVTCILQTGSLGDTQIDVLEGAIAQLLRKATPATICRYLGTSLQDSLQPHCKMLSESQPSDFLHKCHIRWQSFRSTMLPLLEGSFLPIQESLDRRSEKGILNIHSQCIISFRNNVLLAESVIAVLQKAIQHQREVLKEPVPAWFVQMVLEISLCDTKDNRAAMFRSVYVSLADSRLNELAESKKKQENEELSKLLKLHNMAV